MIIAECGIWHRGSVKRATDLIDAACQAGADAVKFQMFSRRPRLFCGVKGDAVRRPFWDESALSLPKWRQVRNHAAKRKMQFGVSVFQDDTVRTAKTLDLDFIKVASRAALTFPYEEWEGRMLISTGMMTQEDRRKLVARLAPLPIKYDFLHCVSEYPVPLKRARWPGNSDGLSDHSGTVYVAIDAMARGCKIIEVHFCDQPLFGYPDEEVSLSYDQLETICEARDAIRQMQAGDAHNLRRTG